MREWARLYQTPLWLTAAFIGLLVVFAITPDPSQNTASSGPTAEPTPGPRECVVCGIDQQCDPSSGRCMFIKATPLPCVKSSKFDDKAGFCLPTGAPTPVPVATNAIDERERLRDRRDRELDRRFQRFPFDDNNN
jgi:hypothetical protein